MYFVDHAPPHFHAQYGNDQMVVNIRTLAIINGKLTPRATGLVTEWASLHQPELLALWDDAQEMHPLHRIDPLP
jgi:Domain of unknown function (DUF4160)